MQRSTPLLWLTLLALGACRDTRLHQPPPPPPPPDPHCGDGILRPGEQCNAADLNNASCTSLGFNFGTLACKSDCTFDTRQCVKLCGNGVLDPGEPCDGALGNLTCATWGVAVCSPTCTVDNTHCLQSPVTTGVPVVINPGGAPIAAVVPPGRAASLVSPNTAFQRLEVYGYDVNQGFHQPRFLSETGSPVASIAADVDGDGQTDLAAINADGTVVRFVYAPATNSFPPSVVYPTPGACPAYAWVGSGRFVDAGGPADLLALACPVGAQGTLLLLPGGVPAPPAQFIADGGVTAAALADFNADGLTDVLEATSAGVTVLLASPGGFSQGPTFALAMTPTSMAAADLDGDGDLDLVASDNATVQIFENVDGGFVSRRTYPASPVGLRIMDADLDGKLDIAWMDAAGVHVRRNEGALTFSLYDFPLDAGVPLALSIGDFDGTGSPDFAATFSLGSGSTITVPLMNGVR